jgi:indoleamine 2,3-dioxygenase
MELSTKASPKNRCRSVANLVQMTAWYISHLRVVTRLLTQSKQIPLCDNLLQITMPDTPLTAILQDFRSYRPGNHREFLEYVKARATHVSLKSYALQEPSSAALYLLALNQVRDFRWRHWCFTREYILKKTSHPTATGGSPIVTWLPNQLQAVMQAMVDVWEGSGKKLGNGCEEVMDLLYVQKDTLAKEVEKYCKERNVTGSP